MSGWELRLDPGLLGQVDQACDAAVNDAADLVHAASQLVVPIEEGSLEADSGVDRAQGGSHEARVWYGRGAASRYAVVQHDNIGQDGHVRAVPFRHDPGRTDKYLARPLEQSEHAALAAMAATLAAHLGG